MVELPEQRAGRKGHKGGRNDLQRPENRGNNEELALVGEFRVVIDDVHQVEERIVNRVKTPALRGALLAEIAQQTARALLQEKQARYFEHGLQTTGHIMQQDKLCNA